ncbi:MAG: preprotein translocase subunit SecE [Pirellulaceae bacterium]|nr:preprotein translocase subunit SecE [Pirellulaceae bacterium]
MSKQKTATTGMFLQELFQFGLYKRTQGRLTRQVTCGVIWVTFALAAWRLWDFLNGTTLPSSLRAAEPFIEAGVPALLLGIGLWLGVRLVNLPRFADFLIAVEAEMNKVSWPSRPELIRSSLVVIFVIFAMAFVLFAFDVIWQFVFNWIGVRT